MNTGKRQTILVFLIVSVLLFAAASYAQFFWHQTFLGEKIANRLIGFFGRGINAADLVLYRPELIRYALGQVCYFMALILAVSGLIFLALSLRNKALRILLLTASLAFFLLLRYEIFMKSSSKYYELARLKKNPVYQKLSQEEALNLGWAHPAGIKLASSYLNYSQTKPPGVLRIGVFGCSLVQGSEVADGHDFPRLLEEKFQKSGSKNVQVINFGVSAYGEHQSFMLWQFLGRKYDLDFVVLMPYQWHWPRDSTFVFHQRWNMVYGPVHARYLAENGKLRLLPVAGRSSWEAAAIYQSLIPAKQYVTYDYFIPPMLKPVVPRAFYNRRNPFYYLSRTANQEAIFESYRLIFKHIAHREKNLILLINDGADYGLSPNEIAPNIYLLKSQTEPLMNQNTSVYNSVQCHRSALGNRLRADELYSFLTGEKKPKMNAFKFDRLLIEGGVFRSALKPLSHYVSADLAIGASSIASFVVPYSGYRDSGREISLFGTLLNCRRSAVSSLCLISALPQNNIRFIPLRFLLKPQAPVYLCFKFRRKSEKIPIGKIESLSGMIGSISFNADRQGVIRKTDQWELGIHKSSGLEGLYIKTRGINIKHVDIFIEKERILKGVSAGPFELGDVRRRLAGEPRFNFFKFKPEQLNFVYLRGREGQYVDFDQLAEGPGTVDLVVRDEKQNEDRFPVFSYRVEEAKARDFDKPLSKPIVLK